MGAFSDNEYLEPKTSDPSLKSVLTMKCLWVKQMGWQRDVRFSPRDVSVLQRRRISERQ